MENWILSANPNYFDHAGAFRECGFIDWKQTRNYAIGDVVYVYVTKPFSRIRYKTEVVCTGLTVDETCDFSKFWVVSQPNHDTKSKFVRLKLLQEYEDDRLSLESLNDHGLEYPPQGPCRVKGDLLKHVKEVEG